MNLPIAGNKVKLMTRILGADPDGHYLRRDHEDPDGVACASATVYGENP